MLPGRERSLTIPSAVWIQYTNVADRQTNLTGGRTDNGRQQKLRFRIASRGKKTITALSRAYTSAKLLQNCYY